MIDERIEISSKDGSVAVCVHMERSKDGSVAVFMNGNAYDIEEIKAWGLLLARVGE